MRENRESEITKLMQEFGLTREEAKEVLVRVRGPVDLDCHWEVPPPIELSPSVEDCPKGRNSSDWDAPFLRVGFTDKEIEAILDEFNSRKEFTATPDKSEAAAKESEEDESYY